ncbi:MAG: 16S rRNA (adenine(1518)-N(6)/adenine(1519)-N(6))-dimethyltransferase RsmA [Candidatus Thorarchaeota archaeon]
MTKGKKPSSVKIRPLLNKYGIVPDKEHGQNFITDRALIDREVSLAEVRKKDIVLEIGPGIGVLTEALARKAKRVVAIEKDTQFRGILGDLQKRSPNLKVIFDDAVTVDFPPFNKVVSNLPFKVALPIIFKLMNHDFDLAILICQERLTAILICQERLTRRITAKPGEAKYSRISVQVARRTAARLLHTISRDKFFPAPDVSAALLKLEGIPPKFEVPSEKFFREVLKYFFAFREKSVSKALNTLKAFSVSKNEMMRARRLIGERIVRKEVFYVTPPEFGRITRILWDEFGDLTRRFYVYYEKMNLYQRESEQL